MHPAEDPNWVYSCVKSALFDTGYAELSKADRWTVPLPGEPESATGSDGMRYSHIAFPRLTYGDHNSF